MMDGVHRTGWTEWEDLYGVETGRRRRKVRDTRYYRGGVMTFYASRTQSRRACLHAVYAVTDKMHLLRWWTERWYDSGRMYHPRYPRHSDWYVQALGRGGQCRERAMRELGLLGSEMP